MDVIYLYGAPAIGKRTVAHELAKLTGFKVVDNHIHTPLILTFFKKQIKNPRWLPGTSGCLGAPAALVTGGAGIRGQNEYLLHFSTQRTSGNGNFSLIFLIITALADRLAVRAVFGNTGHPLASTADRLGA